MFRIVFHNLEPSNLLREFASQRLHTVFDRFPTLNSGQVILTLSMENSQAHLDSKTFCAKFHAQSGRFRDALLEIRSDNIHAAIAELVDKLLERLNRMGDKRRVKKLAQERKVVRRIDRRGEISSV